MSLESFAAVNPSKPNGFENKGQDEILGGFSEAERADILHKQKVLSSLGYFIGKDFDMPILLNKPGAGWHWNFKENHIKIDPKDLLEKSLDYLRFVISHEGGHRRISRTDFIPEEVWQQPGFSFMMNAVEDPRDNNFVAEAYPKFREQMNVAYTLDTQFEEEAKSAAKTKLGTVPRFLQAGHEYIKQWFNEANGKPFVIDESLPEDVRAAVEKTLTAAQESWWRYPSKDEADKSEKLISQYAEASYRINLEKIWPEFKKLVDEDVKDQQTKKALDDMQKSQEPQEPGEGEVGEKGEPQQGNGIPQELKDKLTPEEAQELGEKMEAAQGEGGEPSTIDPASLSPELKKKIEEYVESLPQDVKDELEHRAKEAIRELEEEINKAIRAKIAEDKEGRPESPEQTTPAETPSKPSEHPADEPDVSGVRDTLESLLAPSPEAYDTVMREVLPLINRLENDLREIFVARQARAWDSGHKFGKKIDLKRRIQEKAKDVSAFESRAWQKREAPSEKDYAITLLVDLSGSMRGTKITETFKAVVVLAEVLNALSIKTEILGFNDRIHDFQDFGVRLTDASRREMGAMLEEVDSSRARYNDDGWALKEASARLARENAEEKFLIALSDGIPAESGAHSGAEFDLHKVVKEILETTDQKLVGLGIGSGTEHVSGYYPHSLADVPVKEMAEKLADLIRDVIANYEDF
ncbi:MAG TPA: VWA domain-containing protein [Candidatus Paceibacterota bacterium]|nr:VWA domain-containing protein [Candidatus Paceibacterota bacterium]